MKKTVFAALLAAASALAAADNARTAALEARLAVLEQRVAELERGRSFADSRRHARSVYVCSITPFQKTYEAAEDNEGLSRSKVRRACRAENEEVFCADRNISCKRYD